MRLKTDNVEYWIKDNIKLPSNFDSMRNFQKWEYVWNNKILHRENGPAIIYFSGTKIWYLNGLCHRIDGPAIIRPHGIKGWCLNDIEVNGEIYQKIQNSSKEKLLVYMIDIKYRDYLPLIEYKLSL